MIKYFVNAPAHRLEVWDDGKLVGVYGDTTGLPAGVSAFVPPAEWKPDLDATLSGQATQDQTNNLTTLVSQGNANSAAVAMQTTLNGSIPTAQGTVQPTGQDQGQSGVRESAQAAQGTNDIAQAAINLVKDKNALDQREAKLQQFYQENGLGPYPFAPISSFNPAPQVAPGQTDQGGGPPGDVTVPGPDGQPIRLPAEYANAITNRGVLGAAAAQEARSAEMTRRENEAQGRYTGITRLAKFGADRRALDTAQADYDWQEKLAAANPANDKQLVPTASGAWTHNAGAANAIRDARSGLMDELATIAPEQAQMATRATISPTSPEYVLQTWHLRRRPDGTLESTDESQPYDPTFKPFRAGGVVPPNHGGLNSPVASSYRLGGKVGMAEVLPPNLRRFADGGSQQGYGGGYGGGYGQPAGGVRTGLPSAVGQSLDFPEGNNYTSPSIANLYQQHQKQQDAGFQMGLEDTAQQQTLDRLKQDTTYQTTALQQGQAAALARIEQDRVTSLQQMQAQHQERMAALDAHTRQQAATLSQEIAYARDQKYRGRFAPTGSGTFAG